MRKFFLALILSSLPACSAEDKQDLAAAAPKEINLNVHFPIPVEPWPLPDGF